MHCCNMALTAELENTQCLVQSLQLHSKATSGVNGAVHVQYRHLIQARLPGGT